MPLPQRQWSWCSPRRSPRKGSVVPGGGSRQSWEPRGSDRCTFSWFAQQTPVFRGVVPRLLKERDRQRTMARDQEARKEGRRRETEKRLRGSHALAEKGSRAAFVSRRVGEMAYGGENARRRHS